MYVCMYFYGKIEYAYTQYSHNCIVLQTTSQISIVNYTLYIIMATYDDIRNVEWYVIWILCILLVATHELRVDRGYYNYNIILIETKYCISYCITRIACMEPL